MRTYKIMTTVLLALLPLAGCARKQSNCNTDKSQELMQQSIAIASRYRDSVKLAKDSATVLRLMTELDDALTKLNYRYPADIYINSSENQNDVLARVVMRTVALRDSNLYRLAHPQTANDTTAAADSVAVTER